MTEGDRINTPRLPENGGCSHYSPRRTHIHSRPRTGPRRRSQCKRADHHRRHRHRRPVQSVDRPSAAARPDRRRGRLLREAGPRCSRTPRKQNGPSTKTIARCSIRKSWTRSSSPRPTMPARCPAFEPCRQGSMYTPRSRSRPTSTKAASSSTTCANTSASSRSAPSSARWKSIASAASSSATERSAK